jgi:chaperone BCS1
VFGLSLYCARLSENGLTESDLIRLFKHLPERCIVLLEDVDIAGIQRDSDSDNLLTALSMPRAPLARSEAYRKHTLKRSMISLAGLLNIIDRAASKEVSLALAPLFYYIV